MPTHKQRQEWLTTIHETSFGLESAPMVNTPNIFRMIMQGAFDTFQHPDLERFYALAVLCPEVPVGRILSALESPTEYLAGLTGGSEADGPDPVTLGAVLQGLVVSTPGTARPTRRVYVLSSMFPGLPACVVLDVIEGRRAWTTAPPENIEIHVRGTTSSPSWPT